MDALKLGHAGIFRRGQLETFPDAFHDLTASFYQMLRNCQ